MSVKFETTGSFNLTPQQEKPQEVLFILSSLLGIASVATIAIGLYSFYLCHGLESAYPFLYTQGHVLTVLGGGGLGSAIIIGIVAGILQCNDDYEKGEGCFKHNDPYELV